MPWNAPVFDSTGLLKDARTGLPEPDVVVNAGGGGDYTTLAAMESGFNGGGIVEVQASTPGGTTTYSESWTITKSGTNGNERIYRVRAGDTVRVEGLGPNHTLQISGASYIRMSDFLLGNQADWTQGGYGSDYGVDHQLEILNSDHLEFIDFTIAGGDSYDNIDIVNSQYLRFKGGDYGYHGTNNNGGVDDRGDQWNADDQSNYIICEDIYFHHGGHNCIQIQGNYFVLRNCELSGDWSDESTGYPGARIAEPEAGDGGVSPYGFYLFEDNIWRDCDASVDQPYNSPHKIELVNLILRYNYYYDNTAANFTIDNSSGSGNNNHEGRIYNNTSYNCADGIYCNDNGYAGAQNSFYDFQFKNNVFSHSTRNGKGSEFIYINYPNVQTTWTPPGGANRWRNYVWQGNIFHINTGTPQARAHDGTNVDTIDCNDTTSYTSNWISNTISAPTYVNAAARTKAGFALTSGSDGYNGNIALTQTNGSGSSSTSLTVDDAKWFYDGWGMSYFGEEGDYIDVGGTVVQISSINYSTNVITLATAISWSDADDVFHAPGGSKAVHKGAAQ